MALYYIYIQYIQETGMSKAMATTDIFHDWLCHLVDQQLTTFHLAIS